MRVRRPIKTHPHRTRPTLRRRGAEPMAPPREPDAKPLSPPAPAAARPEDRVREAGGPEDRAQYECDCGYVFEAAVTASVACPHCRGEQAW